MVETIGVSVGPEGPTRGTILVVEDDPGIAHLERLRLSRAGFGVVLAATSAEARRRIERGGVDLMVMDYKLKGDHSSGLDLFYELRDNGLGLPSVLVTGFGDESLLVRALRAGVRDFLPKTPDYLDYLVPTIERVMTQVRTERQLEDERARRIREQAAREEAEARRADLAESEARFRVLTQAIPQMVWTCRADGWSDFSNERWCEFTGQTLEETYGKGWMRAVHPDDMPGLKAVWARASRRKEGFQTSYRICRAADGAYRWHLARAYPQRGASGEVVRWVGACTDIDDQKRSEESLIDADRRKDEFIAMLAHELRNPLAAINNAVALSRRAVGDEEARSWAVGVIDRQVENLTRLIDDLLDVSRIRTGKLRMRPRRVDASEVVRHALEAVRPFVESKRHALGAEVEPGPAWVEADPTRLEQVFVNLLTNAAKYTDEGGRVDVRAGREGGEFVARVSDNGVGIAPEMLPRVFDLFTQVEGSLDRAHGGLGIGLTLVRQLVAAHGGQVSAESEGNGRGSRFTVRLPLADDPPPAVAALATAPKGGARRVLVVDDSADSSRAMARLLRLDGHETRTADDGRTAVELARGFRPDVVLLDIRLPDIDGYEVAALLRAEPGLGRPLLIAVSGFGQDSDQDRARRAGFDRHVIKPVDLDLLRALVADPWPARSGPA